MELFAKCLFGTASDEAAEAVDEAVPKSMPNRA